MATESLIGLRDRPFDLLLALEAEVLGTGSGGRRVGEELWVGVAFRIGEHALVAARGEIREVITWPGVTRVPRARSWLLGIANLRGQLVPVTDFARWAGLGESARSRTSRVLVVNHPDIPAGLMVDQVIGFRRFAPGDAGAHPENLPELIAPYLLGAYAREDEHWAVVGLHDLVESEAFLQAAAS
ncbi:MAG: chemotaxis protein CheW [Gammaproteobacteria bacterium]